MKLFVWHGVLENHTGGMVAILASSVEEAREVIRFGDLVDYNSRYTSLNSSYRETLVEETAKDPTLVFDVPGGSFIPGGG